jgi:hypothetical protein
MEWWQLVALLFVIAGYVLKHILQAQQEEKNVVRRDWVADARKAAEADRTDEDVARERTELDRRIEEARERRRDMDEAEPTAAPLPRRSIPMPVPTVSVRPVPRYQPRSEERTVPEDLRPVPRVERPRVERPRVEQPPAVRPVPAPAIPVVIPVPAPAFAAPSLIEALPAAGAPTVSTRTPVSPAVSLVLDLLRNRQSLAAAVVLREILDRPVSRRRR